MHVWEIEVDIAYLKMKPGCLEAHRCEDSPQEQLQRRNNDKLEIWREAHHSLSLKVKETKSVSLVIQVKIIKTMASQS